MPEPHTGRPGTTTANQRATRERACAQRARHIATWHELLAAQADPEPHTPHLDMAGIHRAIERGHVAAARMYACHAARLSARHGGPAMPSFMMAVATALGVEHVGVSLVLGNQEQAVNVGSDDALTVLRARAFATGEPLAAIAAEVVHSGLRLDR